MKTELALRYLLLRQMERLEQGGPRDRYLETTRSLCIEVEGRRAYTIRWRGDAR